MALLQTSLTPTSVCFLLNQTRSNAVSRAPSDRGHLTTRNSRSEIQPSESANAVLLGPNGDNSEIVWEGSSRTNHQCWCVKATSVLAAAMMGPVVTCSGLDAWAS